MKYRRTDSLHPHTAVSRPPSSLPPSLHLTWLSHLCREAAEEGVPEVNEGEGEVLVKEVAQELAHAQVGPAAVHQQEALKEAELGEGVVAGQHGLHPLLAWDAHTYMCRWVDK